jgi:CP family cyanate transporter-like MFS transporter
MRPLPMRRIARRTSPFAGHFLLLAAVALIGLNLRPFLAGIGPLAGEIGADTGLGLKGIALLTLVPMLLMGVFAFAGPFLQNRIGARRAIIVALVILSLGSLLRLFATSGWEMVGTAALLGLSVAVIQAVFPGVIKAQFPRHVSVVMGLYSATLMAGGALGAQAAPLIAQAAGDWRIGLGWMALPALAALGLALRSLPDDARLQTGGMATGALLQRPRTWLLIACFGLVNGGYATAVAWLAPFYQEHGWSAAAGGSLLAIMALCQAVAALLLPILAARGEDRRPWLWLTLAMQAGGFATLAFWPDVAPLTATVLLGFGLGGCFALALIVALDHLADPLEAGALSALMQGGGFLITALPPWIVAVLYDLTGSFRAGWVLHLASAVSAAVRYWRVSPASYAAAMNRAMSPRPAAADAAWRAEA